jgi:hypothetical protein
MTDLTAIDILVNPDDETISRAKAVNERLRQSVPTGYALDASHQPHITTLQRYVRTADLELAFDAVEKAIAFTDISALGYEAAQIAHLDWGIPGQGLTGFVVKANQAVLDFQATLLANVSPYVGTDGTAAAYFTDDSDPDINETTLNWVGDYVPNQIGAKYTPHISLGFATLDDLKVIEAEPFKAFTVHPASIAIYHLGNNGTARNLLKRYKLTNAWPK